MDLYGDLPPTKDGSEAISSNKQIQLLKKPVIVNPIPEASENDKGAESNNVEEEPIKAEAAPSSSKAAMQAEPKLEGKAVLFMKPTQLKKLIVKPTVVSTSSKEMHESKQEVLERTQEPREASTSLPVSNSANPEEKQVDDNTVYNKPKGFSLPGHGGAGIVWTTEEIEDEYDPAEPNNYELYLENRMKKEQEQATKRRLDQQLKEQEEKRRKLAESRKREAVLGAISKSEPAMGGSGRGRDLLVPAWVKKNVDGQVGTKTRAD